VEYALSSALVTGVTGFVGSHLAKELIRRGYKVFGVVRPCSSRDLHPLSDVRESITLLTADIVNYTSMANALRSTNPDVVFHLAALTPVRYSFEHPFQYEQINYLATMNICHAFLELPDFKKRFLLAASTAEVYGPDVKTPTTEDSPLNPSSPYAVSKAAADMYLRMASRVYDLNCVVMRPTNTYGRKYETGFIIEYLITSMLKGERPYVGAPDSVRDYIYVDDHVRAYVETMEKRKAGSHVYNAASGVGVSNRKLAEKIANIIGYDQNQIVYGSYPPGYPLRPIVSDQLEIVLDPERIRREVGWVPKTTMDEGLKATTAYWKQGMRDA
jgi:dTDP-glucose 4,6-dehydratase